MSYPASSLGLADRGTSREGAKADLLLFDPAKVHANADYVNPTARAEGFDLVMVNPAGAGGRQNGGARGAAGASRGMKDERCAWWGSERVSTGWCQVGSAARRGKMVCAVRVWVVVGRVPKNK